MPQMKRDNIGQGVSISHLEPLLDLFSTLGGSNGLMGDWELNFSKPLLLATYLHPQVDKSGGLKVSLSNMP